MAANLYPTNDFFLKIPITRDRRGSTICPMTRIMTRVKFVSSFLHEIAALGDVAPWPEWTLFDSDSQTLHSR
jgi:hypothetical protein